MCTSMPLHAAQHNGLTLRVHKQKYCAYDTWAVAVNKFESVRWPYGLHQHHMLAQHKHVCNMKVTERCMATIQFISDYSV